jgi:hypothetical protein
MVVYGWMAVAMSGCEKMESRHNAYATYVEVQRTKNKGGWIPPYLPKTAINIQEFHYVDSPSVWVVFNPRSQSRNWPEEARCKQSVNAPALPSSKRIAADWWPAALTVEEQNAGVPDRYRYYECPGDLGGSLAVTEAEPEIAFFWR